MTFPLPRFRLLALSLTVSLLPLGSPCPAQHAGGTGPGAGSGDTRGGQGIDPGRPVEVLPTKPPQRAPTAPAPAPAPNSSDAPPALQLGGGSGVGSAGGPIVESPVAALKGVLTIQSPDRTPLFPESGQPGGVGRVLPKLRPGAPGTVDQGPAASVGGAQGSQPAPSTQGAAAASPGTRYSLGAAAGSGSGSGRGSAAQAGEEGQSSGPGSAAALKAGRAQDPSQAQGSSNGSGAVLGVAPVSIPGPGQAGGSAKALAGGGPIFVTSGVSGQGGRTRRDPQEVLLETGQLLDENAGDLKARTDRAEALVETGDFEAAAAEATKVLETEPTSIRALNARAYANNKRGQYAFALQDADLVVKLAPDNALGHLNRAMALEGLGRLAEALEEYALAARLDPTLKTFLADAQAKGAAGVLSGKAGQAPWRSPGALGLFAALFAAGAGLFLRARRRAAAARPAASLSVGAGMVIGGNYRIDKLIGEGGMGKVFEGFDTALRRKVAVKIMRAEIRQELGDAQILEEARLVALVRHPNVVQVYAALQESGEIFLVFDFVSGKSLHALVKANGRLGLREARHVLGEIAAGLDCAHAKRVIHRDLKPANVVISEEGVAKLMDFGIAHRTSASAAGQAVLDATGTLPYMAPEQAQGAVSPQSDLYALGVMAYEMLTGQRPFTGEDQLDKKRRMEFAPASSLAPGLPPGVDAALARALAAEPEKRFRSGKEFVDALA